MLYHFSKGLSLLACIELIWEGVSMMNQSRKSNLKWQSLLAALLMFAFALSGCGAAPAAQSAAAESSVSSAAVSSGQGEESARSAEASEVEVSSEPAEEAEEGSEVTIEQGREAAIEAMQEYLANSAMTRSKVADYVAAMAAAYEFGVDFSAEDVDYVVDNCGADWKQEALEVAEEYLDKHSDYYSDSDKLMRTLTTNDGFTEEEAAYAVENCGLK